MGNKVLKDGKPDTTDQWPRWEGPPQNRRRGYLAAKDDSAIDKDAAGETLRNPEHNDISDAAKTKGNH